MGKVSLLKSVAAKEIHISQSDKGKGICVMPTEMYHQMLIIHRKGDKKVTWRDSQNTQRELRAYSRALARKLNLGKAEGGRNRARCYDNMSSWACDSPILRCVAKTHKPAGENGVPQSSPIVGACKGLTTAPGQNFV